MREILKTSTNVLKERVLQLAVAILQRIPRAANLKVRNELIIFKPDHIGDFILALKAIDLLIQWWNQNSGGKIVLVVSAPVEKLARQEFPSCEIVPVIYSFDSFWRGCFSRLLFYRHLAEKMSGGVLVSLRHQLNPLQQLVLSWSIFEESFCITRPPQTIYQRTFGLRKFKPSCSCVYPKRSSSGICLELEAHASLLSLIFKKTVTGDSIVPKLDSHCVSKTNSLMIFPCANSAIREYPSDLLAEVVSRLNGIRRWTSIELVAEPKRINSLLELQEILLTRYRIQVEVHSPQNIKGAVDIIAAAGMIIAMESAPAHIATALDRPGVFIIGGGHYGFFAPWSRSKKQLWLNKIMDCYGCNWNCIYRSSRCINEITPTQVVEAAVSVLRDE